jgi:hypothetical protein
MASVMAMSHPVQHEESRQIAFPFGATKLRSNQSFKYA